MDLLAQAALVVAGLGVLAQAAVVVAGLGVLALPAVVVHGDGLGRYSYRDALREGRGGDGSHAGPAQRPTGPPPP